MTRFTFTKDDLAKALKTVSRATGGNHPVLQGVHFKAREGFAAVQATDLDTGIYIEVPAEVEGEGEFVLPAKEITSLVEKSPSDEIILEYDRQVTLTMGVSEYKLNAIDGEFPQFPQAGEQGHRIRTEYVEEGFRRTLFAVSKDEHVIPVIQGILVATDDRMTFMGTDGFTVAECIFPGDGDLDVVVPREAVPEILNVMKQYPSEYVKWWTGGNHLHVTSGPAVLSTVLLEGNYPDVLSMLTLDGAFSCRADRQELLSAIERAAVVSEENRGFRPVTLEVGEDITIKSSSAEMGQARDVVGAECGGEASVKMQAAFLLNALKHVAADEVEINFTDSQNPMFLREDNWTCYILPMRER